ncbi:MAG: flagellin, partial [Iodobacter sp.]
AGLQIATRMDAQSRGMQAAMKNTQNGISMLQTAEGALGEVSSILLRMKDLATEAANGTASADDKTAMQSEFDALGKEMSNIVKNTSFGGEKVLGTTGKLGGSINFQIGASADEKMTVDLSKIMKSMDDALIAASNAYTTPGAVGTDLTIADAPGTPAVIGTGTAANPQTPAVPGKGANAQIDTISAALKAVGTLRSDMGANANRLDHVYNNLGNMDSNTKMAKGRIMDTDYATEQAKMTSNQMLMQAGTSMLKQSGSMSQMVMSLMQ